MTTNEDEFGESVPRDAPPTGDVQDERFPGPAASDSAGLGSAIGSQFDPPAEPILPVPPAPPAPGTPAPAGPAWGAAPTTPAPGTTSPENTPWGSVSPENTPWGSVTGSNIAPPADPTPPPGAAYNTPSNAAEYAVAQPAFGGGSDGGSSKLPWILAAVAAVVLLGGGAFFAVSAFGASGGAASPDEGIESVLGAIGEEDFVTLAELMEPSERRTLAEPAITELLPEMIRLGLLDDSADAGDVEGLDLVFTNVEYRVDRLVGADDIAHVFLTGGELAANVDSASLPFTDSVDTEDLNAQDRTPITESDTPLVFVQRDGDWYFSLWYTIAENARIQSGDPLPSIEASPPALPSESPELAVEAMFDAVTDFDLETMIGLMDPDEMSVLYRYSPLFLDDAQSALNEVGGDLRDEGVEWDMTDFDFEVSQDGDDAVVAIRGFSVEFLVDDVSLTATYSRDAISGRFTSGGVVGSLDASPTVYSFDVDADGLVFNGEITVDPENNAVSGSGSADGETLEGSLQIDEEGVCSRLEVTGSDGSNESFCVEDETGVEDFGQLAAQVLDQWPTEFPGAEMRARQTNGGWYVSPIGTIFDAALTSLEDLDEENFDGLSDTFGDLAGDVASDPFAVIDSGNDLIGSDDSPETFADDSIENDPSVIGTFEDPVFQGDTAIDVAEGDAAAFSGEISENSFDTYSIELEAGSTLVVTAQADNSSLDTTLRIVNPLGNQAAFNDDAISDGLFDSLPSGFDSRVTFTTESTGLYVFEVAAFDAVGAGAYILTVDRSGEAALDEVDEVDDVDQVDDVGEFGPEVVVPRGDSVVVSGEFPQEGIFSLSLDAGDEVIITVLGIEFFDPTVALFDDGGQLGFNDDAPGEANLPSSFDSQLIVTAQTTGVHEIILDGFGGSTGDFTMTVERN